MLLAQVDHLGNSAGGPADLVTGDGFLQHLGDHEIIFCDQYFRHDPLLLFYLDSNVRRAASSEIVGRQ
jgi:hypothetical protein